MEVTNERPHDTPRSASCPRPPSCYGACGQRHAGWSRLRTSVRDRSGPYDPDLRRMDRELDFAGRAIRQADRAVPDPGPAIRNTDAPVRAAVHQGWRLKSAGHADAHVRGAGTGCRPRPTLPNWHAVDA